MFYIKFSKNWNSQTLVPFPFSVIIVYIKYCTLYRKYIYRKWRKKMKTELVRSKLILFSCKYIKFIFTYILLFHISNEYTPRYWTVFCILKYTTHRRNKIFFFERLHCILRRRKEVGWIDSWMVEKGKKFFLFFSIYIMSYEVSFLLYQKLFMRI